MNFIRHVAQIAICLLICPATVSIAEETPKYIIAGMVTNSVSGVPIARVLVALRCFGQQNSAMEEILTDGSGAFRFTGLAHGLCNVTTKRPGFEDGGAGSGGGPIAIGPSRENVHITMKPVTVITGRVVDRSGEPVEGVQVQALRSNIVDGRREPQVYAWATTDDKGRYRLANLWQGPFYVRAMGSGGRSSFTLGAVLPESGSGESFSPVYYSGASDMASATSIPGSPGEELHADLMITKEPGYRIRGVIGGYIPNQPATVELLRGSDDFGAGRVLVNPSTAQFEIHDVTSGSYLLRISQGSGEQRTRALLPIQIAGADVTGVRPELAPGVEVVFEFQGSREEYAEQSEEQDSDNDAVTAARDNTAARHMAVAAVQLQALDTEKREMFFGQADEKGNVHVRGLLPGRYSIHVQPFSAYISSMQCGSTDLLESLELHIQPGIAPEAIEVALKHDGGSVEGSVTDDDGPLARASVILVSASHPANLLGPFATNDEGGFRFGNVAPGAYTIWAWRADSEVEYRNPAALQALGSQPASVTVTAEGEQKVEVKLPGRDK